MKQTSTDNISHRVVMFILTRKTGELAALTGQKIAEILGIDPLKMIQAFEADQHISPDRFIVREKMHRAFFLLEKNRDISIKELAEKIGYTGFHEFANEFERYFLIDPGRYQELVRLSRKQNPPPGI